MKNILKRSMMLLVMLMVLLPLLSNSVVASAATSLSLSKMTLVGEGATSTLTVKNVDTKKVKRMTWYTQNAKVAIVDAKTGFVTAVGKGTTNIKVKITYKNGKVERPKSRVTVTIPATEIAINNAKDTVENNNRHTIMVGEKFNFNATSTPKNTSDKQYWSLDNDTFATVSANGTVTGKKPGMIRLEVRAAASATAAKKSLVNDIINIEIVAKSAKVENTKLIDTNTFAITFSHAMKEEQLIGLNKKLHDNISIVPKTDEKNVAAQALGALTATLSSDGKVLTVKSENIFNGLYGVAVSGNIEAKDGTKLYPYFDNITLYDTEKPHFTGFTTDESGLVVSLNFNEPINFTNLAISDASILSTTEKADITTISLLSNRLNYVVSEDKKSLLIDMTTVVPTDQNKVFSVKIFGIKDFAGNDPAQYPITAIFKSDTTPKAQARVTSILRTGYNMVQAKFSRPINFPGYIFLSNGDSIQGIVDSKDKTLVNYTLSSHSALLTGLQEVGVAFYDSYNVSPQDTTATQQIKYKVNFTVTRELPKLVKTELVEMNENNIQGYVLKLTYDKDVTASAISGSLPTRLNGSNGDIDSNRILSYTALKDKNEITLILSAEQIAQAGLYTVTLPQMFVYDDYMNASVETVVRFSRTASSSSALPAPVSIKQSDTDSSTILVVFKNKVDLDTAQRATNYTIVGTTVISAEVTDNSESGATVQLKIAPNTISSSNIYPVYVNGVSGYHNTYTAMDQFSGIVYLRKNTEPKLMLVEYKYPLEIVLTFNEVVSGVGKFQVLDGGVDLFNHYSIIDNKVTITLKTLPSANRMLQILSTHETKITDGSGNEFTLKDVQYVSVIHK